MNGTRRHQRPDGLPCRRPGAQFHPRRRQARRLAVRAQPHHARSGGAPGHSPAHPQTRSVSPTEAGERLLARSARASRRSRPRSTPCRELRDKPAGTIRITAGEHAVDTVLWPRLEPLLPEFPDIKVEIDIDYGLTDIVAERYEAGVRLGEHVAKDMIAVRIGPDWRHGRRRLTVLLRRPLAAGDAARPHRPSLHQPAAADLWRALCLGVREGRAELNVRVDGQLVFNSTPDPQAASPGSAWPMCPRIWLRRISRRASSSACLTTGARLSRATISITRAAASPRRPSPCGRCAAVSGLDVCAGRASRSAIHR